MPPTPPPAAPSPLRRLANRLGRKKAAAGGMAAPAAPVPPAEPQVLPAATEGRPTPEVAKAQSAPPQSEPTRVDKRPAGRQSQPPAAPVPTDASRPAASTKPAPSTPGAPAAKDAPAPAAAGAQAAREQPAAGATERPGDQDKRSRRAWNLRRFTSSRRPETPPAEPQTSAARTASDGAGLDRLSRSIESVTEALGGQSTEFYERELPQIAASEIAKRTHADVIVLLLDNGQGLMKVSGEVGLTRDERQLSVDYSRDVMRELFRTRVGLIEDTDRVRGALAGIPGSRAETLVLVPLVHEQLGFGVLMAGRDRSPTGKPAEVFTDRDVQALLGFADAVAEPLHTAVLLRHLKAQFSAPKDG
jgi:hypothetical protein